MHFLALAAHAATVDALTVRSADGALSLAFDAKSGRLLLVNTTSLHRSAVRGAGWCSVVGAGDDGAATATLVMNGSRLCVKRTVGPLKGGPTVLVEDCYAPSRHRAAVEWTSTVRSDAAALFSVPLGRGLSFVPRSAQGEDLWSGSDNATGSHAEGQPNFLLGTAMQARLGDSAQWLGGYLTASGTKGTTGAYAFSGPTISVPAVMISDAAADSGLVLALDLADKLSTRLSLNTSFAAGKAGAFGFSYGAYRLGAGSAPLVFHADVAAVAADPRAALQFLTQRWPTFFEPAVAAARTMASGTGWYSKCGPAVGGCDLQGTNKTYAAELKEIQFSWVW